MKHWLIGSVAAMALVAACGGGDKSDSSQSVKVGDVKVEGLKLQAGDASKSGEALTALSLNESGAGRVNFADSSTSGAAATFNDVSIGIDADSPTIDAGSLVFKGLDMTDAGASFSQMTLSDISVDPEDEDGALKVASLQLTNPSPELAAWVGSLMGQGEPAAFPALDKLSFDGLSMGGLEFDASGIDEVDVLKVGGIDFRSMSSTGLGSMVLDGIEFSGSPDGESVSFSLGSMGVAGMNEVFMGVLTSAFANGASGGDPEDLIEEISGLMSANPGDPGYDSFTIDALNFDAAGVAFDLPSMLGSVTRDKEGRATRSVTEPFKMSLKADPEGELGSQLAGPLSLMGYEELKLSGQSDVALDPDTDSMTYTAGKNYIALEDGFKFALDGSFSGLSEYGKVIAANPDDEAALLAALSSLSVSKLGISFEDDSIVERGFAAAAAMTGQDAEGLKVQATAGVAALPLLAGQAGIDPAMAAELGGALSKFLDSSGTLEINFAPESPLTATDFEDPTALTKDRLGFSATTN